MYPTAYLLLCTSCEGEVGKWHKIGGTLYHSMSHPAGSTLVREDCILAVQGCIHTPAGEGCNPCTRPVAGTVADRLHPEAGTFPFLIYGGLRAREYAHKPFTITWINVYHMLADFMTI